MEKTLKPSSTRSSTPAHTSTRLCTASHGQFLALSSSFVKRVQSAELRWALRRVQRYRGGVLLRARLGELRGKEKCR